MRQLIQINLLKSELLYDVELKTYLTGKSRQNGNNYEEVANMQASADDENRNQILRSFCNAIGTVRTLFAEFGMNRHGAVGNTLPAPGSEFCIELEAPCNFDKTTVSAITTATHQFLVNTAIGDWFTITNKKDTQEYYAMAQANLAEIRRNICERRRPRKPCDAV